ncbi:MAG: nickel pincer cofactor biosynthesis protein LarC [Spartobacteria bacterium]|nr:nickel pincer cofactor biosynthesis protein LarC [Spartobacteria bacterium]
MNILHFDSVGGASGDMVLGALVALGADVGELTSLLSRLPIDGFQIECVPHESHGLTGVQLRVHVEEHAHDHHDHHHRSYRDIRTMLEGSNLPKRGQGYALEVFRRLAVAEGEVHGKPAEEVHFHEVGGMDSIIDIVGSCVALDMLGVDEVSVGPLPLGCGTVTCQHGVYPVPAPATLKLLANHPVTHTGEEGEMVTPTGAALLTTWATSHGVAARHYCQRSSYSFGQRTFAGRPNVLRASLLATGEDASAPTSCMVLETNIDDCNPELLGCLAGNLYKAGALEVYFCPVQMKKFRPGVLLTALCRPEHLDVMLSLIFRESTTFGIRYYEMARACLVQDITDVETPYGDIPIKVGCWKGEALTAAPEMDACRYVADRRGVAVRDVYAAAAQKAHTLLKGHDQKR